MSEKQSRGICNLSKYDAMTTEELEEILRLDAQAPEEHESDTEMTLYIMEVLVGRKRNNGHTGKTTHEAYESFKQNYMPEIEEVDTACEKTVVIKGRFPRWLRSLTAAAVVLVILLLGSVTAKAFGFNIWKAVVQWTQDTFHIGEWVNSNTSNNLPYVSIQEALEKGNTPVWLVPKWLPDGYKLVDISVEQNPLQKIYRAKHINGEQFFIITVQDHLDNEPFYVEQSDGLVEEYEASGIIYYLFTDISLTKAKWINASYECSISGNLTMEELKMMIESIEKG